MAPVREIALFDDAADYLEAGRSASSFAPVLLRPASSARGAWQASVLRGYLDAVDECTAPAPQDLAADWLLSLDPQLDALCAVQAAAQSRPWRSWKPGDELSPAAKSVCFVGFVPQFTLELREQLMREVPCPWGILCDVDLPGLVFQCEKMRLMAWLRHEGTLICDGISGRIEQQDADGNTSVDPFDAAHLAAALARGRASLAAVQMHGRGSHAVAADLLFCGVMGDAERDLHGTPIHRGCRHSPDGQPHCKMAKPHQSVIRFRSIPAPVVGLFSCASSAFPGDFFPSASSAVISALEGFPAHVIGANHIWTAKGCESALAFDAILSGMPLGQVVALLNQRQLRLRPHKPFLLFGDPAVRVPESWRAARTNREKKESREVAELAGAVGQTAPPVGGEHAASPSAPGHEASMAKVPIFDDYGETAPAQNYQQRFAEIARRAIHWDWLLLSLQARYETRLESQPAFREGLGRLQSLRIAVVRETQRGLALAAASERSMACDPLLPVSWDVVTAMLRLWDAQLARLVHTDLFKEQTFDVFSQFAASTEKRSVERCAYCASALFEISLAPPTEPGRPFMQLLDCPLCSEQDAWYLGNHRHRVQLPKCVRTGESLRIEVTADTTNAGLGRNPDAILVASAFDRCSRCRPYEQMFPVPDSGHLVLDVPVPREAAPRTHPVQFAIVNRMALHLSRRFVAVVD